MELLLLIAGAAVGLGILYLIWRGLRGLADFLENDGPDYHDGEW